MSTESTTPNLSTINPLIVDETSDAINELQRNNSKAGLILQGISQAIIYADNDAGNVQAVSNWLALIDAAVSEVNRIITGLPLGFEDGYVTTIEELSNK